MRSLKPVLLDNQLELNGLQFEEDIAVAVISGCRGKKKTARAALRFAKDAH
jgi:hypothetical protein